MADEINRIETYKSQLEGLTGSGILMHKPKHALELQCLVVLVASLNLRRMCKVLLDPRSHTKK